MKKIYLVLILISASTIIGAGCSNTRTTSMFEDTTPQIGKIAVPAEGNAGTFNGNIDTLALVEEDLPTAYAPYEKNTYYESEFFDTNDSVYGNIKGYDPQQYIGSTGFTFDMTLITYEDTATAAGRYNSKINFAAIGKDDPKTMQGSFDDIGDESFYVTTPRVNEQNSDYNSTYWEVFIVKSNMVVTFIITTPTSYTEADLKALLTTWQDKLSTYKPATE
jgi:hypothetical protein